MISSRTNPKIQHAIKVREGDQPALVFVEGERLADDLLDSGWSVEAAFYSSELSDRARVIVERCGDVALEVSEEVMRKLSSTVSPPGIVLLARKSVIEEIKGEWGLVLVLDAVQDPGNVGTLLRTAEAAGAEAAVLLEGCADPFSPKALRASMGSAFRLPIMAKNRSQCATWAKDNGLSLVAAAGGGEMTHTEVDWTKPTALVLGNEANGVGQELLEAAQHRVSIPLQGCVESLNVAAAAAVLLFEAARQRDL
jgi:RNA methyltransferase, TrmH family